MLGYEKQDAPIRRLEDSQKAPRPVKVQSANARERFSGQPDARSGASA